MDLIEIQPKDFMFLFGMTLTDLTKLKLILDNMQFNFDGTNPDHVAAKEYLETRLYKTVQSGMDAVEEYNNGT